MIKRRGVLFQKKGLPGGPMEKDTVKKMERFTKCSLFKYRQKK